MLGLFSCLREKICVENSDDLEDLLGDSVELYPTIPAIEVTIPHIHTSMSPVGKTYRKLT
jgi:hypothetical protein